MPLTLEIVTPEQRALTVQCDEVRLTGVAGVNVTIEETIDSFEQLTNGDLDDLPEQAFFNVGGVESVREKAKSLSKEEAGV